MCVCLAMTTSLLLVICSAPNTTQVWRHVQVHPLLPIGKHCTHLPWDDQAEALTVCGPVRRCPRLAYLPFRKRSKDSSTSCSHTKEKERNLFLKDWQCRALDSRWAMTLLMAEVTSGSTWRVLRYRFSWPCMHSEMRTYGSGYWLQCICMTANQQTFCVPLFRRTLPQVSRRVESHLLTISGIDLSDIWESSAGTKATSPPSSSTFTDISGWMVCPCECTIQIVRTMITYLVWTYVLYIQHLVWLRLQL